MAGEALDTRAAVQTPEGVSLLLRAAGPLPRACAWALDLMIRLVLLLVLSTVLGAAGASGIGLFLLALFAIFWFYPILFEVLWNGQTPGKKVMRLRVVRRDGTPVGWLASVLRNLLRTVDMLPYCYGFGLVACLVDRWGRRLGDIVAGTLVVYADEPRAFGALPEATPEVAPLALRSAERAAVIEFAMRSRQLTPERQEELAGLLPALTRADGEQAVRRLQGMAASFLGRT